MQKKPLVTFVILHYLAIKETMDCVYSLVNNLNYNNYKIIIVDNGSNIKEDVEALLKLENQFDTIEVIISDENLGFAQGNNLGFIEAKNKYQSDFIILLNNDTLIRQKDFCQVLCKKYDEYHYAVMGPKIYLKDGSCHSNPMIPGSYIIYKQFISKWILYFEYLLSYINLDISFDYFIQKLRGKSKNQDIVNELYNNDHLNYKLHGSCLIFSEIYINRFNGLNSETFLYLEEDILFVRLKKNNFITLYSPEISILHLEDAATDMVQKNKQQKRRFIYKNHVKSYDVLIKELKSE